jgi:DNA-binding NtrC family response regulator
MRRVLLVEDEDKVRQLFAKWIRSADVGVIEAVSVKTALMHLDVIDLSAIFLDLRLPNGHGREVIKELIMKRDDVPVVVLSAVPEDVPLLFPVVKIMKKPANQGMILAGLEEAFKYSDAINSIKVSTRKSEERQTSIMMRGKRG